MTVNSQRSVHASILCCAVCIATTDTASAAGNDARSILSASGIKGGLVVHVGCGNGQLTAALRATDKFLVHGLEPNAASVAAARAHVESVGLAGKVSIAQWSVGRLPYADNIVNLLVLEGTPAVAPREALRVLCPGGAIMEKQGEEWAMTSKPRPANIDEWTHFLHDGGGNAVAQDERVGPPRHIQWLADPLWIRNHHTLASVSAVVSAAGRLFCIIDEGPSGSIEVPARWTLAARDAFNGVLLWKRLIASWASHRRRFRSGPVQLTRLLVAVGDRVYVSLGMDAPVTALDGTTGETVKTYPGTEHAEELVLHEGVLLVLTGAPAAEQAAHVAQRRGKPKKTDPATPRHKKTIAALDPDTGEMRWKWSDPSAGELMPLTLAAAARRVFFQAGQGLVCLSLDNGRELWRSDKANGARAKPRQPGWSVATLVARDDSVLWADGRQLRVFASGDGKLLWSCSCRPGFKSPVDLFVVGGLVWFGPGFTEGRDLKTGEVKKRSSVSADLQTAGHHHRCYRNKATDRYIMTGKRGIEFIDIDGTQHSRNNWLRGLCQYGIMPCNGLIYVPPHSCGCYMEAKLFGFWAAAANRLPDEAPIAAKTRLARGPAYASISNQQSAAANPHDWPTYRHDGTRSGSTKVKLSPGLKTAWQAQESGRLTAPVVAEGLAIVSAVDTHRVIAFDADTGKLHWSYTPGGPVDSPPTIHAGLVIFGCRDGSVYCLRASDGALVWRFLAAPEDRRTVALGHVESVWPVHGSVLVKDGVAYAAAGRSSYLDGGILLYGLDPRTGRVLHQTRVSSQHATLSDPPAKDRPPTKRIAQNAADYKTHLDPDRSDAFSMAGTTTDVLVSDGHSVYMRHVRFDATLAQQPTLGRHLLSTSGLLDDAENHRSHWVLGTGDFSRTGVAYSWIANSGRSRWNSRLARPYGIMLAFDEKTAWGVRRSGYQLFSQPNKPFAKDEEPRPDFQPSRNEPTSISWTWAMSLPVRPRAMLCTEETLFVAGMPRQSGPDGHSAFEGRKHGVLLAVAAGNGSKLAEYKLDAAPVWDGMAAARGKLYISLVNGTLACMAMDPAAKLPAPGQPASRPTVQKPNQRPNAKKPATGRPGARVKPDAKGRLVLQPETARTTGRLRYQPDRNNLGAWTDPRDYCEWNLRGVQAGTYTVDFSYGSTHAGTAYTIVAGDAKLTGKTEHTGGIKTYKRYRVGTIALPGGDVTLAVKPGPFQGAIMNFRLLELSPAK